MNALVAGFEPFGSLDVNPSAELAQLVAARIQQYTSVILPTSYRRSVESLDAAIETVQPACVLMLGYAATAHGLRLEPVARNEVTARQADNDGLQLHGPIDPHGPLRLLTLVDVDACAEVVAHSGAQVTIAERATGYVCNYAYYHELQVQPELPAIFAHLSARPGTREFETIASGATSLALRLLAKQSSI